MSKPSPAVRSRSSLHGEIVLPSFSASREEVAVLAFEHLRVALSPPVPLRDLLAYRIQREDGDATTLDREWRTRPESRPLVQHVAECPDWADRGDDFDVVDVALSVGPFRRSGTERQVPSTLRGNDVSRHHCAPGGLGPPDAGDSRARSAFVCAYLDQVPVRIEEVDGGPRPAGSRLATWPGVVTDAIESVPVGDSPLLDASEGPVKRTRTTVKGPSCPACSKPRTST